MNEEISKRALEALEQAEAIALTVIEQMLGFAVTEALVGFTLLWVLAVCSFTIGRRVIKTAKADPWQYEEMEFGGFFLCAVGVLLGLFSTIPFLVAVQAKFYPYAYMVEKLIGAAS